jgi:hypothetical protein
VGLVCAAKCCACSFPCAIPSARALLLGPLTCPPYNRYTPQHTINPLAPASRRPAAPHLSRRQRRRSFFQGRFQDLQQGLFAQQPALFPAATFTPDNLLWAVATVRSRTHAPLEADRIALVPLADSLPHSRRSTVAWRVKAGGLFSKQQVGGRELCSSLSRLPGAVLWHLGVSGAELGQAARLPPGLCWGLQH